MVDLVFFSKFPGICEKAGQLGNSCSILGVIVTLARYSGILKKDPSF